MAVHDQLGVRMKEFYEEIPKTRLVRRMPVAIRIDGKAFHTFTKGLKKPFDEILITSMQKTMQYLCENIQGCVFGYTQSDEISLILIDYNKLTTDAWFGYEVQKMVSIAASMATMTFNKIFSQEVSYTYQKTMPIGHLTGNDKQYLHTLYEKIEKGAMFDARCFNIPKEEVTNLIYWRQLDAVRNSIQALGQANFSQKALQNKNCVKIKEMLSQKNIIWEDLPISYQRGSSCIKKDGNWIIDKNMPILKGEDRNYLDKLIFITEEAAE